MEKHSRVLPIAFANSERVFAVGVEAIEDDMVSLDSRKLVHRDRVDTLRVVWVVDEVAAASDLHDDSHSVLDRYDQVSVEHSFDEVSHLLSQWHMKTNELSDLLSFGNVPSEVDPFDRLGEIEFT